MRPIQCVNFNDIKQVTNEILLFPFYLLPSLYCLLDMVIWPVFSSTFFGEFVFLQKVNHFNTKCDSLGPYSIDFLKFVI